MVALATQFAEAAADIRSAGTETGQWRLIGHLAVTHVPGCNWASVSDVHASRGRSFGASDAIAARLDQLQYDLGEGPCLQSAEVGASVLCADLDKERRWPNFVARARSETALRSVLAIRLPGRDSAAMNFYADQPDTFDDTAIAAASILAAHAAGLLAVGESAARSHNLEIALGSNRRIGMAIGVLMAITRSPKRKRSVCYDWPAKHSIASCVTSLPTSPGPARCPISMTGAVAAHRRGASFRQRQARARAFSNVRLACPGRGVGR